MLPGLQPMSQTANSSAQRSQGEQSVRTASAVPFHSRIRAAPRPARQTLCPTYLEKGRLARSLADGEAGAKGPQVPVGRPRERLVHPWQHVATGACGVQTKAACVSFNRHPSPRPCRCPHLLPQPLPPCPGSGPLPHTGCNPSDDPVVEEFNALRFPDAKPVAMPQLPALRGVEDQRDSR